MTNEELILAKLENLESQIAPLVKTANTMTELKDDLVPLGNHAVQLLINELQEVEAGFQLEDLFLLIKQAMRSVRNLVYALKQLDNVVEFVQDLEPLLKSAVPKAIEYLDDLEQRGVIRMVKAMMELRAKVASAYTPEDIEKIGDGLVATLGLAKSISDPRAIEFLGKMAALPSKVDLSESKKVGPMGLMSAGFNNEVKEGFGVMIELTKAMGKLKENGSLSASEPGEQSAESS